ncbi:UDP-N-acetylmuramoyl-tripeptide--D-alanyl-D-alanine ligase [Bryobacterales bacterium F-183]|nr:UDP-N-acetylmuramoyl-tripeptide--D-alanyl-D-alanine ligase [Bryobacterales bacterium F-183]
MTFELAAVAAALGLSVPAIGGRITGWSIDSRTVAPGDLFFALKGPNHDAHQYVPQVLAAGATAVVVDRDVQDSRALVVPDTLGALQRIASWARAQFTGKVIGVTGSAGKTTTKDIIAALLSTKLTTGKTVGNFNNHVGLPLSILRLPQDSQAAVLELGMNHGGEIRDLSAISKHSIAVVTNVGPAHIENFESIEGIAAAKRELVEALPADGLAVLNADDPRVAKFATAHAGRTVTYGIDQPADIRATDVHGSRFRVDGVGFDLPLTGRHNILNVLAGIAVAREFGIATGDLVDAVSKLSPGHMRGERIVHNGMVLWNDCYNANPSAMKAMLDVLRDTADAPGRRIAVLGEMLELGHEAEAMHREVGSYAAMQGVSVLLGVRGAARHFVDAAKDAGVLNGAAYLFFETPEEAGEFLRTIARQGDAILFKGSRGTQVERALQRFMA